ncbi:MAG TPA: hypothetical protein PL105_25940, partial [Caldilineaceae bacterium]|nr:hypothetical protein [Caldilineaceae bacterium]
LSADRITACPLARSLSRKGFNFQAGLLQQFTFFTDNDNRNDKQLALGVLTAFVYIAVTLLYHRDASSLFEIPHRCQKLLNPNPRKIALVAVVQGGGGSVHCGFIPD